MSVFITILIIIAILLLILSVANAMSDGLDSDWEEILDTFLILSTALIGAGLFIGLLYVLIHPFINNILN